MALPKELKPLKRFVREAKKTEKLSPVIAYYCRLYAIQEAMKLDDSKKTAASKQWMSEQMTLLEANAVSVSREEAQLKILQMANNVFKHADDIDRAGNANKQTAAAFNSSFVFYEILKQFGGRDDEIVERAKYCMFKTTDILKALKEGRKPKPGPPGNEEDELENELNKIGGNDMNEGGGGGGGMPNDNLPSYGDINNNNNNNDNYNMKKSPSPQQPSNPYGNNNYNNNNNNNQYQQPSQPKQPTYQQPKQPTYQQPKQPTYQQPSKPKPQQYGGGGGGSYMVSNTPQYNYQRQVNLPTFEKKIEACMEAEKIFKEAMGALRFEDVDTAIKKAQEAIAILSPHK